MQRFRRSVYHRLLALVVLVGLGAWVSAPLAANPHMTAASVAKAYAVGPLESVIAEALAVASRADMSAAVFAEALLSALEAHPEGEALRGLLAEGLAPEVLYELLVGKLLRSPAAHGPLLMATVPAQGAPACVSGLGTALHGEAGDRGAPETAHLAARGLLAAHVSIWTLSAAQPLGP